MITEKQVVLSVNLIGMQTSKGVYSHFCKQGESSKLLEGIVVEKRPKFSITTEVVRLKEQFVQGALTEIPVQLQGRISEKIWNKIPENKRIAIHVNSYVRDMFPNNRGYKFEIT